MNLEGDIPMVKYALAQQPNTLCYDARIIHVIIVLYYRANRYNRASSTDITSPAAAFQAATDATASASKLAFNAAAPCRTSASPGIKSELS